MPRVSHKKIVSEHRQEVSRDIQAARELQMEKHGCAFSIELYGKVKGLRDLGYSHDEISTELKVSKDSVNRVCTWLNKTTINTPEVKEMAVSAVKEILSNDGIVKENNIVRNNITRAKLASDILIPKVPCKGTDVVVNVNNIVGKQPLDINPDYKFEELNKY